ncbi:MAG TPA: hypothetical protein VNA65_04855, partial [Candidatus Dormibacteraeota bacterium]|nr:hypothetical protein [Candidatus Dormibacteraeota bacterium]
PRGLAAALTLDCFDNLQQRTWSSGPFRLEHLIQELRLIHDTPRLGLDDAALTQNSYTLLTQAPARGTQIASARSKV